MADVSEDANDIEKLYEYGERLNEAKDKSQNVKDYEGIIRAARGSIKAKQLAAQLIPRFFKFFPSISSLAVEAHFDLCEEEELGVRVQAIRGLPLFCKDTPEYVSKIVDILGQLLTAEENVERDAVHKALMSLLRQDVKGKFYCINKISILFSDKLCFLLRFTFLSTFTVSSKMTTALASSQKLASLTALFKHIESTDEPSTDESIRERVLSFIKDKVFPLKAELLKPQEQMERHATDLVKKSLQDVTGAEFKMFMDFLISLSIFGENAPPERVQELIEIIEGQADLDAQFNVSFCFWSGAEYKYMTSNKYASAEKLEILEKGYNERFDNLEATLSGAETLSTNTWRIKPEVLPEWLTTVQNDFAYKIILEERKLALVATRSREQLLVEYLQQITGLKSGIEAGTTALKNSIEFSTVSLNGYRGDASIAWVLIQFDIATHHFITVDLAYRIALAFEEKMSHIWTQFDRKLKLPIQKPRLLRSRKQKSKEEHNNITCYNCGAQGNFSTAFPKLKTMTVLEDVPKEKEEQESVVILSEAGTDFDGDATRTLMALSRRSYELFKWWWSKSHIFKAGFKIEVEGDTSKEDLDIVSDGDHIDRLISCLYMALLFFMRGASNSKFLTYLNKFILPVFDELPEERKLDLLKNLAESSPYTTPQDSRQLLPSVVQLLKKYMPRRKTGEEMNFTYVECLLYTLHHLSHKTPNATNSLCGYKIVTGQPSDRLGEDFSENFKDFTERVNGGFRGCLNQVTAVSVALLKRDKTTLRRRETQKLVLVAL
ncbi:hypothetical protein HHK36_005065 [Tetracentron sinense]|uniref:Apoptosis inhibitor 5 n=1 Tax=Tetracentron sinense TaxID=13715 RepID=A0A835DQE5_TETSI|nr:hypothetical protein HHK36_005065 [Tetracentron sinense]